MQPLCSNQYMKKHLQHLTMEFRMSASIGNNELTGWSRGCQFYPLWYMWAVFHVSCIYTQSNTHAYIYKKYCLNYFSVYKI